MAQIEAFNRMIVNMMRRYGGEAYIIKGSVDGVYDPDTSEFIPNPPQSFRVEVIIQDYPLRKDGVRIDGTSLIETADKMVYVRPYKFAPLPAINPSTDFLQVGNYLWKIVAVKEENPTLTESIVLILYIKR